MSFTIQFALLLFNIIIKSNVSNASIHKTQKNLTTLIKMDDDSSKKCKKLTPISTIWFITWNISIWLQSVQVLLWIISIVWNFVTVIMPMATSVMMVVMVCIFSIVSWYCWKENCKTFISILLFFQILLVRNYRWQLRVVYDVGVGGAPLVKDFYWECAVAPL